jgi:hypothetical protein
MCKSCEMIAINGVPCHEPGCPDAWLASVRECKECGMDFTPDGSAQRFCDDSCAAAFYGWPDAGDDDAELCEKCGAVVGLDGRDGLCGHCTDVAAYLAEALKGRWSNREGAYILAASKEAKFRRLYDEGWDATIFGELIQPKAAA